jgi:hypothetical protein
VSGGFFIYGTCRANKLVAKPFNGYKLHDITNDPDPSGLMIDEFILRRLVEEFFINIISGAHCRHPMRGFYHRISTDNGRELLPNIRLGGSADCDGVITVVKEG